MAVEMTPVTAPEPVYRSPWQKWVGFWFPAADPTTLGFIRIMTGLLVLYIHLAYSVDLQAFFGRHAWYSQSYIERERHEFPWNASPLWDWKPDAVVPAKVPEFPHRRRAFLDFMRGLPADEGRRKHALEFLRRVSRPEQGAENPVLALSWFQDMRTFPERRDRYLDVLTTGKVPTDAEGRPAAPAPPAFLAGLAPPERERAAQEVRAFWDVLPDNRADNSARAYVLNHFTEVGTEVRTALVEFLYTLPNDPAERAKKIDYLDYWNNEPEKSVRTGHNIFSVWFHVTDPTQMALVHAALLFAMLLFTVGLFTRVTSVIVWVAVIGYIHRTQQVLFGMDTMTNVLLFYLMIGNSGAALSVDRVVARYRAVRASLRRTGTIDAATRAFLACPPPCRSAGFALRLIQVHFCFIYMASGLAKLKGSAWWDGRAVWDVMVNPEFTLMQHGWYEKGLRAMARVKPLYYAYTVGGVWGTLAVEIAGPFLLWTRLRWLIIFLATAMHAVIAILMGLNLFELLMVVMLLAFLPDGVIRDQFRGRASLARLRFAFDPGTPVASRAAALAVAADVDGQVTLAPEPALASPVLTDPNGTSRTGDTGAAPALFETLRLLAPFRLLARLPGLRTWLARLLFPPPPVPASTPAPPATPAAG